MTATTIEDIGFDDHGRTRSVAPPFPADMVLTPLSRNPIRLEDATVAAVMDRPVPAFSVPHDPSVPLVNIVVVTFDNLLFTRMCLESLLANTEYANYEVCVVDNASTDGTPDYLRQIAAKHLHVRFLVNDANLGFAAANNQALKQASGDILILLNNDTLVSKGWVTGLVRHLQDLNIGLVGPTTNRLGNEAEIETSYRNYGEFEEFAGTVAKRSDEERFDIRIGSMFCLAMRRNTFERLGPLDEQFGIGMLEDDDYSMRARAAGLRVICAENLFVHHFGSASIGKLAASGEYGKLFHTNRRHWEAKWGRPWEPPSLRPNVVYENLRESIRRVVCESTPPAANLLVVSKGDEELLNLLRADGREASHFPQTPDGCYAGCYPADSQAAIAQLEQLRAEGGEFLLFPCTASWWLDHYRDFAMHLERRYRQVARHRDTCLVYALREGGRSDV
jgi:GT2 family glycosyltransferase